MLTDQTASKAEYTVAVHTTKTAYQQQTQIERKKWTTDNT